METIKIYKHETVTSVAEVETDNAEQALKFARVADGMPNGPVFEEVERRNPRFSLEATTTRQARDVEFNDSEDEDEDKKSNEPAKPQKEHPVFKKGNK